MNITTINRNRENLTIVSVLVISTLSSFAISLTNSEYMVFGFAIFLLLATLLWSPAGVISWLVVFPLISYMDTRIDTHVPLHIVLSTPVILGYYTNAIFKKKSPEPKPIRQYYIYIFLLLFLGIASSMANGYYENIHVILLLTATLIISAINASIILEDRIRLNYVSWGLVCAALVALMVSLIQTGVSVRLSLGDNVRQLANILGFSLVLVAANCLTEARKKAAISILLTRLAKLFFLVLLLTSLIATMSRGVIVSVMLSIGLTILYFILTKRKNKTDAILIILISFLILLVGMIHIEKIMNFFHASALINLERRIDTEELQYGIFIRSTIWTSAVDQMKSWQYFFGAGFLSFRRLAQQGGIDFYAHSTYLDIFTSVGGVGLLLMISLFYRIAKGILNQRSLVGIAVFLYISVSFMTHGSITSVLFWIGLGILYALSYKSGFLNGEYFSQEGMRSMSRFRIYQNMKVDDGYKI